MLLTLEDLGVPTPVYIRKIGAITHWQPEDCSSQHERAEKAAARIFKDGINSLYLVKSNEDFYATIVAISRANASKFWNPYTARVSNFKYKT